MADRSKPAFVENSRLHLSAFEGIAHKQRGLRSAWSERAGISQTLQLGSQTRARSIGGVRPEEAAGKPGWLCPGADDGDDVMPAEAEYVVDRRDRLGAEEFAEDYVRLGRPVLVKCALDGCAALSRWSLGYLREQAGHKRVPLKKWGPSGIQTVRKSFDDYVNNLELYESRLRTADVTSDQKPAYLHDVPLTSILPEVYSDLERFPSDYFPHWYRTEWWKFAQLFLGPSDSITPLHFDCLLTHNLFFQITGRKRFVLIAREHLKYCYPHDWRWCAVNVEEPDYDRFPHYRMAKPASVIVEPGDCLYLPPGTLHHVRSLNCALSFNVDWHTKDSALNGVLACARGMPWKNVYYNAVIALGLWSGISQRHLLPYYRSYLNYVS